MEPTEEEQELLDRQAAQDFTLGLDSLQIAPTREWEGNTWRKRLYIASGNGGVARLNLDEQNGLQVIQEEKLDGLVSRLVKQGDGLFAATASVDVDPPQSDLCAFKIGGSSGLGLAALNYQDGEDPVRVAAPDGLKGAGLLKLDNGWLLSGGLVQGAKWANCPGWDETLAKAIDLEKARSAA